jgi:hypothetical protein
MVAKTIDNLYGSVKSPDDIRKINETIREEMDSVTSQEQLTELKKRSDYLCTLTFAPSWQKRFGEDSARFLQVALEENRKTVAKANSVAEKLKFNVEYHAWREQTRTYKRSEERYAGGGLVKYIMYRSPQPLRNGRSQLRTRVKRVYFPADAREIRVTKHGQIAKRTGRETYGIALEYRYQLAPATVHRGKKSYELPERWAERKKIVELPKEATDVRLVDNPPEGPKMAVA